MRKLKITIGNMDLVRSGNKSAIHVKPLHVEEIRKFAITQKDKLPLDGLEVNTLEVDESDFITLIEELGVTDWFVRDEHTEEFLVGHFTLSVVLREYICKPLFNNIKSDNPLPLQVMYIGTWMCTWINYNVNMNERPIIQLEYID